MNKITIKDYAEFWQNLPQEIKPLPSAITFWGDKIKEILKQNKKPKALILGVTPEIRDLLTRHKINSICLDINQMMAKAMTLLIKKRNVKEKIIIGNWLKMPFPENYFDFVISDCPQDNLPYKKFNIFFNNINKILKPNGYLMLGTTYFKGSKDSITLKQYLKIYRKNPKLFKNISWKFYYIMKLSGHKNFYNNKTKIVNWLKIDNDLKKYYKKRIISKKELDILSISTNKLKISLSCRWTWISKNEFYNFFKKNNFYILGRREDDVFPAGYFRQAFILKKYASKKL